MKYQLAFDTFSDYIRAWSIELNISHYEWQVSKSKKDSDEYDGRIPVANVQLIKHRNLVVVNFFPAGSKLTEEELWYVACHECVHVMLYPLSNLLFDLANLDENSPICSIAVDTMEQVVDNLARQYVKCGPLYDTI